MSLFYLRGMKVLPQKLKSVKILEHIEKFNLDLCSPIYSNSPQVSYLGMNPGRGWNPNVEGSYLPEYSESESEVWTQCTSIFYLQTLQFSAPNPFPIMIYCECTKTYQF